MNTPYHDHSSESGEASPFEELLEDSQPPEPATQGQRFLNYFIDSIVFFVIVILFGFFSALLGVPYEGNNPILEYAVTYLIYVLYYWGMEAATGQTVGKMLTRTRVVVSFENYKPSHKQLFIRSLCRLIPFDGLSFVFGQNGWHDQFSNTDVVKIAR